MKQLRQDSKKSIVFYPDIGHSGHSDATFHCLRLSQRAVDLMEALLAINPAFRNPSIVASVREAALRKAGISLAVYTNVTDHLAFQQHHPNLHQRDCSITNKEIA
ncbi:hypothetical protein APUTEX25_001170, partial [Auxenochlorella protothecoides]